MQRRKMVVEYLEALNLHDVQECELDFGFLSKVVKRHVATFAFSSVSCRLGKDLPLDFESLFNRIVVQRRGGYCFEQNGLLYEVLEELGFSPELYLARVIFNKDNHPGLTHRISIVEQGGLRYVLDVGFGYLGPRIPVLMSENESNDGGRLFRVAERNLGEYHMQVFKDGDFFSLYRFDLARYGQADCELGHFYSHRHPEATFVNYLVVSRILASETRSLRDLDYWVITKSGIKAKIIGNPKQLREILVKELGVQVTEAEGCRLFEGMDAYPKKKQENKMTNKIGVIKDSIQDARSGKLIFLSHCLLNQNACVRGLAGQPAVIRELVDLLLDHDVAFYQMPCPEVTYLGSMRWGQVKKQYGNPMFRRHCRQIAEQMCDQIQTYRDNDHHVIGIVLRDGSPTCGLKTAAVEADEQQVWGGMVWNANPLQRFAHTPGVFSQELLAEIEGRTGFEVDLLSLPEVPEAGSIQDALDKIALAVSED